MILKIYICNQFIMKSPNYIIMCNIEKIRVFIYSVIIMSALCEKLIGWKRSWVMVEKVTVQNSL